MQCQAELIRQPSPHLIWRLQAIPQTSHQIEPDSLTSRIFQQSSAAMLIMDAGFNIVSINPAFKKSTGFNLAELQGQSVTQVCDSHSPTNINHDLLNKLSHKSFYNGELLIAGKNKQTFPAHVYIDALQRIDSKVEYYLLLMLDISAQKQRESELRYHAEVDPLTKLGNRKLLFQSLENAIASAKRFNYTVAVLFLDLDGFKQVNDHFGHGKGDDVLQEVAQRLQSCVRQVDTVTRLGGDEFVVILNGTSKDMIAVTALRIIDFLTLSVKDHATEIQVSASIGISIYPQDSNSPMVLLKYADDAMYKAKEQGKRQFCWHFEP
jgi:diguanylate cyclase (GGDEF)-like protein/PAS domain S-box-containing protein